MWLNLSGTSIALHSRYFPIILTLLVQRIAVKSSLLFGLSRLTHKYLTYKFFCNKVNSIRRVRANIDRICTFYIGAVGKISGLLPSLPVPATWAGGGRKHPSQVQVADFSPAGQPASAHGFPRKKVKFLFTWNVIFTCWSTCVGPRAPWEKGKISITWNVFLTCWSTWRRPEGGGGIPWGKFKISFIWNVFFTCWSTCVGPGIP